MRGNCVIPSVNVVKLAHVEVLLRVVLSRFKAKRKNIDLKGLSINFTVHFTKNVRMSISMLNLVVSLVAIYHIRRLMSQEIT